MAIKRKALTLKTKVFIAVIIILAAAIILGGAPQTAKFFAAPTPRPTPISIQAPTITPTSSNIITLSAEQKQFTITSKPGENSKAFVRLGGVKSRTATFAAPGIGPKFPDLTAELVSSNYSVETDVGITIFKIINKGDAAAIGPFTVNLFYSNVYNFDIIVNGQLPAHSEIPFFMGIVNARLYGFTPSSVKVTVDSDNGIFEKDESNNVFNWPLKQIDTCDPYKFIQFSGKSSTGGPDLQAQISLAAYSESLNFVRCVVPIGNGGDKTVYANTFNKNVKVTGPGLNVELTDRQLYDVPPNQYVQNELFIFNASLPDVVQYQCTLTADVNNDVKETNESNNVATAVFYGGNKCAGIGGVQIQ